MATNFLGLAKSYAQLSRLPQDVAIRVAPLFNARFREGFASGTDPYGGAWAPLAASTIRRRPWRGPPPLTAFGALKASAYYSPQRWGWRLSGAPFYGAFHMSGTSQMPKRRWLPDSGLPATWRDDIQSVMTTLVAEKLGKR